VKLRSYAKVHAAEIISVNAMSAISAVTGINSGFPGVCCIYLLEKVICDPVIFVIIKGYTNASCGFQGKTVVFNIGIFHIGKYNALFIVIKLCSVNIYRPLRVSVIYAYGLVETFKYIFYIVPVV